jgi:hypothetical protein
MAQNKIIFQNLAGLPRFVCKIRQKRETPLVEDTIQHELRPLINDANKVLTDTASSAITTNSSTNYSSAPRENPPLLIAAYTQTENVAMPKKSKSIQVDSTCCGKDQLVKYPLKSKSTPPPSSLSVPQPPQSSTSSKLEFPQKDPNQLMSDPTNAVEEAAQSIDPKKRTYSGDGAEEPEIKKVALIENSSILVTPTSVFPAEKQSSHEAFFYYDQIPLEKLIKIEPLVIITYLIVGNLRFRTITRVCSLVYFLSLSISSRVEA